MESAHDLLRKLLQSDIDSINFKKICSEMSGHDERMDAVRDLVDIAHAFVKSVELDCDQMCYEHSRSAARSDGDLAQGHYCDQFCYAADAHRMAAIQAGIEEGLDRQREIDEYKHQVVNEHNLRLDKKQLQRAIENI